MSIAICSVNPQAKSRSYIQRTFFSFSMVQENPFPKVPEKGMKSVRRNSSNDMRLQILTEYAIFVTTCSMRHSYPPHKGKEPHRLVKLFSYSKTSDAILRYAFRRYFLTVSGDRFISNATCTQERPRTSHSTRHAISSGGSSKDRMYATARRGAIEDNFARIARCCLSMLCAGACRALTRGEACLPPVFLSLF